MTIAIGDKLSYPSAELLLYGNNGKTYDTFAGMGVGGFNGTPTTPASPPVAAPLPNCTAITGIPVSNDFGSAYSQSAIGNLPSSKTIPAHAVSISCTAGSTGSSAGTATLYAQSNNVKATDKATLLASAGDWLGMYLLMPATLPANVSLANGQALGQSVKWDGNNPTPLWAWKIPSRSNAGVVTLPTVSLQPRLYQTSTNGMTFGQRNYIVTYTTVIQ
jgi:hypothetical protein